MGILGGLFKSVKPKKRRITQGRGRRSFQAAEVGRLTNDWPLSSNSPNDEVYRALTTVRARARYLKSNNEYAKKYSDLMKNNIVGPDGITLQVRAVNPDGSADDFANNFIESSWDEWGRVGVCTVNGQMSFVDVLNAVVEGIHIPGEILVREVFGPAANNRFNYALELYEADYLDELLNKKLPNGNQLIMGIEFNQSQRPINFYMFKEHPGGSAYYTYNKNEHIIIRANEMILLGLPERIGQARFISPMLSGMYRAKMLGGYEEAELVAARTASAKMGFFTSPDGDGYGGDDMDGTDSDYDLITEAEPGTWEQLPEGVEPVPFDPQHPTTAYSGFMSTGIRALANAWGVNYESLANDRSDASWSSLREGNVAERDNYKCKQRFLVDHLLNRVYGNFLKQLLGLKTTPLPPQKYDKFNVPEWQGRGWHYVDPLKETMANKHGLMSGQINLGEIQGLRGRGLEEFLKTRQKEIKLAQKYGFDYNELIAGFANAGGQQNGKKRNKKI